MTQSIRNIPAVHEVIKTFETSNQQVERPIPAEVVKGWAQYHLRFLREDILQHPSNYENVTREMLMADLLFKLNQEVKSYRPNNLHQVLNGTGTVLHTNLGRARLSNKALERVIEVSKHYSTLEYNVSEGKRGSRHDIIKDLLIQVTGAEAAMVVNNNAAAVFLILRALCKGKEVIVSRGELVEIGGSFRISTIMEESDAKLVEVGTTNKTHAYDYEQAISENTRMLMKVHTSNFKTVGFTKEVSVEELKGIRDDVEQSSSNGILVYEDLGSGSLYPFRHDGIGEEPIVKEALNKGADIISFSGDKLLGGPQAGVIAGKKEVIDLLKKHPLARVLRVDKMTLAALEASLQSYIYDEVSDNPTIRDILLTEKQIQGKVDVFLRELEKELSPLNWKIETGKDTSLIGGGTMPTVERPTVGITVEKDGLSANKLEGILRKITIPVISRMKNTKVFIDFRTIDEEEIPLLIQALKEAEKLME
ncbi:L-seryl-tRNA(Sec) selenium transferase [Evansella tamaricis]|uniref:L-seryl-tRNA(Sec) selenium transferase n=1 Tax=Evansella tamaricis TaxID=2069301 RepID=A0ABS6JJ81_9BACI|nr:L-seryl-tRNA(Sec) selenium transferase [Evansella tamaricis]MBU9712388.1 L-seryl-tRNA(Sec) selenium transferase [Evansella tamaricis]